MRLKERSVRSRHPWHIQKMFLTFGSNQVSANFVICSGPPEQILLLISSVWLAISSGNEARYILSTTDRAVSLANRCIIPSPRPTENTAAPVYDIKMCQKSYDVSVMKSGQIGFIAPMCETVR